MFEWIFSIDAWLTLATLTALEIVLGIDNIILLAVMVGKAPPKQRDKVRYFGLGLAMCARIGLLCSLFWIMKLVTPLFTLPLPEFLPQNAGEISGRDLVLFFGGLFLVIKPIFEIIEQIKQASSEAHHNFASNAFWLIIVQIIFLDIVFSLDSRRWHSAEFARDDFSHCYCSACDAFCEQTHSGFCREIPEP